ncbi:uncharacterized protein LOC128677901 [Plodia interpunctella]|uniref:uncharacterized protein LOC128677901 n=1 Tax=Plodia interpunctella TaxID=58824 RepID=UPI002368BC7D|nr:uncharacterized protein LOC128677901 [Plodia interpunctella]
MTCLPFGLATAPRMFASITNWTAEVLRSKGIRVVVYLDDYCIAHQDQKVLNAQVTFAINFLTSLEKSITSPSQSVEFLGITWDTWSNLKALPQDKIRKIRQSLLTRLAAGSWTLKQAQRLLGLLNFATFITHRGRLHCRALQRHSNLLRRSPRKQFLYSNEVREELEWWLENVVQSTAIHQDTLPTNYMITDASDVKWGALVNNKELQGCWNSEQENYHCNAKEMYAVIAALSKEAATLKDSTVILQSDNRTVISYIKNEGGTKSPLLLNLTKELLALTNSLNVVLLPHHLPGMYNTEADHLSRNRSGSEWHLLDAVTSRIFKCWVTPVIDLFASKTAHVVPDYVTFDLLDSNACYHNDFSRFWHYQLAWLFPPPGLIPRILQHLNTAHGHFIVITPKWKKPYWRPDLKLRAIGRPMKIQNLQETLVDTTTGLPPTHIRSLQLEAWLISDGMD